MNQQFVSCVMVLATCAIQPAHSLELSAQSGEHETFSRLVFGGLQGIPFNVSRSDRTYEIATSSPSVEMEIDRVFDFIPRSRILDISTSNSSILIQLNCDCLIRSFTTNDNFLVVDVLDEQRENTATKTNPLEPFRFDQSKNLSQVLTTSPFAPTETSIASNLIAKSNGHSSSDVLAHLSGAVANGRLTHQGPEAIAHTSSRSSIGLSVRNPALPRPSQEASCLPQSVFAFLNLNTDGEQGSTTIPFMNAFSSDSASRHEEAITLAENYIRHGFGSEAIMVLNALADKDPTTRSLLTIAKSIDHPFHGEAKPFADQLKCENDAGFWYFVAQSLENNAPEDFDFNQIKRTFANLPHDLRRHLGPFLASRFVMIGDEDGAAFVTSASGNSSSPSLPDGEVIQPKISEGEELTQSVHGNDVARAIRSLRLTVENDSSVSPAQRDSIEALLHAGKGRADSNGLFQDYVRALLDVGDIVAAIDFLSREAASDFFADRNPAMSVHAVGNAISASRDDVDFLRLTAHLMASEISSHIPGTVRRHFLARLIDIGLPDLAGPLNVRPSDGSEDFALYSAAHALNQGYPAEALARVQTREGEQARQIRINSLLTLGEYRRAAEKMKEAGDFTGAGEAFWLAEDWAAASVYLAPSPRKEMATLLSETSEASAPFVAGEGLQEATNSAASIIEQTEIVLGVTRRFEGHMQSLLESTSEAE